MFEELNYTLSEIIFPGGPGQPSPSDRKNDRQGHHPRKTQVQHRNFLASFVTQ